MCLAKDVSHIVGGNPSGKEQVIPTSKESWS